MPQGDPKRVIVTVPVRGLFILPVVSDLCAFPFRASASRQECGHESRQLAWVSHTPSEKKSQILTENLDDVFRNDA